MSRILRLSALLLALAATAAQATPTHVMVRARAQDAKFIGDHMGGIRVTLRDAKTRKVLARGLIKGGTGDTGRLMKGPQRGVMLSDAQAAGFEAVLDLDRPTLVEADAEGPLGKPAAKVHVTAQAWILPGHDLAGDGWILTFPGLVIEPDLSAARAAKPAIAAKVSLMCGCPIEPGGLWDAAHYSVRADLLRNGRAVSSADLAYGGKPSLFVGELPPATPGAYRLRLTAQDSTTANVGVWEEPLDLK